MVLVLLPVVCLAILAITLSWVFTFREIRAAEAFGWLQAIALASVLAVTIQATLPFVMLFMIDPHSPRIDLIAVLAGVLFLIALSCSLIRKGPARWLLAPSSLLLALLTGFIDLVSGIQF